MITADVQGITLLTSSPPSLKDDPWKVSSSQRSVFRQKGLPNHKWTVLQTSLHFSNFSSTNLCINTVVFSLRSCLGMHTTILAARKELKLGSFGPGRHQSR